MDIEVPANKAMSGVDGGLPAPNPPLRVDTREFWSATSEGRLLLPRCVSCGLVIWYPRGFCPQCHSMEIEWIEASGSGTIYSITIVRRGGTGVYRGSEPYSIAYVELDEGIRMMSNIVSFEESELRIGLRVSLVFSPTEDGSALPRFEPADKGE